jgi:DNA-binding transcriptional ArsR family regulator
MDEAEVVNALAALAQPLRLQIFRALVVAGGTGLTPGALVECLGASATTLSFHLKELTHAHLVTQQRLGRYLIYHASFERMNELLGYLTANCCKGQECLDVAAVSCKC